MPLLRVLGGDDVAIHRLPGHAHLGALLVLGRGAPAARLGGRQVVHQRALLGCEHHARLGEGLALALLDPDVATEVLERLRILHRLGQRRAPGHLGVELGLGGSRVLGQRLGGLPFHQCIQRVLLGLLVSLLLPHHVAVGAVLLAQREATQQAGVDQVHQLALGRARADVATDVLQQFVLGAGVELGDDGVLAVAHAAVHGLELIGRGGAGAHGLEQLEVRVDRGRLAGCNRLGNTVGISQALTVLLVHGVDDLGHRNRVLLGRRRSLCLVGSAKRMPQAIDAELALGVTDAVDLSVHLLARPHERNLDVLTSLEGHLLQRVVGGPTL